MKCSECKFCIPLNSPVPGINPYGGPTWVCHHRRMKKTAPGRLERVGRYWRNMTINPRCPVKTRKGEIECRTPAPAAPANTQEAT